ncbi:MAG TPA: hypothetical protein ENK04_12180 [Gammaproteobacteria bacterium]|nr:hypothetical protein [Gammaproteobacteria bacterium]
MFDAIGLNVHQKPKAPQKKLTGIQRKGRKDAAEDTKFCIACFSLRLGGLCVDNINATGTMLPGFNS